jgi:hypothetical protein
MNNELGVMNNGWGFFIEEYNSLKKGAVKLTSPFFNVESLDVLLNCD